MLCSFRILLALIAITAIACNGSDALVFEIAVVAEPAPHVPIWMQQAYAKATNSQGGDYFGGAVAIDGDTLVIGSPVESSNVSSVLHAPSMPTPGSENNLAAASGAVYVYVRLGEIWEPQAYLKAPNAESAHAFGSSVAISGNTIVVGAHNENSNQSSILHAGSLPTAATDDDSAALAGAAYVFVRSGTTWSVEAYLKASNAEASDNFGASVAIDGDMVIVGAPGEDSNQGTVSHAGSLPTAAGDNDAASAAGAAYVFTRSAAVWSQQAYLKACNAEGADSFGEVVAISGDTVVVGAKGEDGGLPGVLNAGSLPTAASDSDAANGAGAAHVFVRSGGVWSQQAYLKSTNVGASDLFGYPVAISGDTIVVGAHLEDGNNTAVINSATLPSTATANNLATAAGAAYVFFRTGTTWSQQAYLKAPNAEANDEFGYAIAISGDTIVVGAHFEDSNQETISQATALPTPAGDSDANASAGAAYVFTRESGTWSQNAYLKAPNPDANDRFASALAISGSTIVAGAWYEDSNATGLLHAGNLPSAAGDNDSAAEAGAAYVFLRR
ncbi:FG-GAP repeat protein [Turneriella parva]|uniref:Integrin alpha beta-propellor repeat protein n=1 Tax=Turneriella parva (strain ATCC BAA-1111 / DSM 21527 / NCTC 11395 / H) TaxID=869212 RepID=I4B4W6_TURPD|nr:FG-GAP repeat protein [Turneriella parva]AFM12323.1 hypothetical protein Turpa_1675 [Turneriella parva DSM 21527]